MSKFEDLFEDLDTHTQVMDSSMSSAMTLSTPQDQVEGLMKQVHTRCFLVTQKPENLHFMSIMKVLWRHGRHRCIEHSACISKHINFMHHFSKFIFDLVQRRLYN